jgi:hypothetical protein
MSDAAALNNKLARSAIPSFEASPKGSLRAPQTGLAFSNANALAILPRLARFCAHRQSAGNHAFAFSTIELN